MSSDNGRLYIGTSGYQYDHWRNVFYPSELRKKEWFDYYQRHFAAVEINNTFYRLPEAETFDHWRQAAAEDFCYVLKYSRYGSHIKRLKDPDQHLTVFTDRAVRLGERLGPVLVQLPPRWRPAPERLASFLEAAPAGWRWALEFRDERWLNQEVFAILRRHGAALCIHDLIDGHPREFTADWSYWRFHGQDGGDYPARELAAAAGEITACLQEGRDAYVFFNNDAQGYAVRNAQDLRRRVTTA
ncbi:MAG: DUF72 domain-containing protein [Desulfosudaceae bacterium]